MNWVDVIVLLTTPWIVPIMTSFCELNYDLHQDSSQLQLVYVMDCLGGCDPAGGDFGNYPGVKPVTICSLIGEDQPYVKRVLRGWIFWFFFV